MGKIVKIFGFILLAAGAALILIGHIGVITGQGWRAYFDMMSPFNIANYAATVAALIPGMFFVWLGGKL